MAGWGSRKEPPSLKEAGGMLTTAMTRVRAPRSRVRVRGCQVDVDRVAGNRGSLSHWGFRRGGHASKGFLSWGEWDLAGWADAVWGQRRAAVCSCFKCQAADDGGGVRAAAGGDADVDDERGGVGDRGRGRHAARGFGDPGSGRSDAERAEVSV